MPEKLDHSLWELRFDPRREAEWKIGPPTERAPISDGSGKANPGRETGNKPKIYLNMCDGIGPLEITNMRDFVQGQLIVLVISLLIVLGLFLMGVFSSPT
jgi:hypothetical protein